MSAAAGRHRRSWWAWTGPSLPNGPCAGPRDQAKLTGATLKVVTTWEYPPTLGWAPPYPSDFDPNEDARKAQHETVGCRARGRSLVWWPSPRSPRAIPPTCSTKAARGAELLVVGSRGHGAFAGMLLGSVSEYCAAHAPCPVVVVRRPRRQVVVSPVGRDVDRWRVGPGTQGASRPRTTRRRPTGAPGDRGADRGRHRAPARRALRPAGPAVGGVEAVAARRAAGTRRLGQGRHHQARVPGCEPPRHDGGVVQGAHAARSRPTTSCGVSTSGCPRRGRSASSTAPTTRTSSWRASTTSCPNRCGGPATATSTPSSETLVDGGTTVVKFFLHVSFEEQGSGCAAASRSPTSAGRPRPAISSSASTGTPTRPPTRTCSSRRRPRRRRGS